MKQAKTWRVFVKLVFVLGLGIIGVDQARADACHDGCNGTYASCTQSSGEDPNCLNCDCNCALCYCYADNCRDYPPAECSGNGCDT